jgi:hypothetical protein
MCEIDCLQGAKGRTNNNYPRSHLAVTLDDCSTALTSKYYKVNTFFCCLSWFRNGQIILDRTIFIQSHSTVKSVIPPFV